VKRITVSLPDDVYRLARIKAAERNQSVSAMAREYLTSLVCEKLDFEKGKRLQTEVLGTIRRFRAGDRITRDAVHRRRAAG